MSLLAKIPLWESGPLMLVSRTAAPASRPDLYWDPDLATPAPLAAAVEGVDRRCGAMAGPTPGLLYLASCLSWVDWFACGSGAVGSPHAVYAPCGSGAGGGAPGRKSTMMAFFLRPRMRFPDVSGWRGTRGVLDFFLLWVVGVGVGCTDGYLAVGAEPALEEAGVGEGGEETEEEMLLLLVAVALR